ncbi:hypothetical protein [Coleofasciculus sp. H7-2]|uniref:hypothetical protein n=1 Tax=Coleofasciculus sp. H7-2 TaxID=3351545 RepID=UPI00366B73D6
MHNLLKDRTGDLCKEGQTSQKASDRVNVAMCDRARFVCKTASGYHDDSATRTITSTNTGMLLAILSDCQRRFSFTAHFFADSLAQFSGYCCDRCTER